MNQNIMSIKEHLNRIEEALSDQYSHTQYAVNLSALSGKIDSIDMDEKKEMNFEPVKGRIIFTSWIRIANSEKGLNVVTLYGMNSLEEVRQKETNQRGFNHGREVSIINIETEGAYFYVNDAKGKHKLQKFDRDTWYCVCLKANMDRHTYQLYIDGCEQISNGILKDDKATSVHKLTYGSNGGMMQIRQMRLYENVAQSLEYLLESINIRKDVDEHGLADQKLKVVYDAYQLGIPANGQTLVTEQLQSLINQCSEAGGGIVYLSKGTYLTGTLEMKSDVTLYIEEDATLKGTLDIARYPRRICPIYSNLNIHVEGPQKALIYGEQLENVSIMGGGIIDGSGDFYGAYQSETERPCAILFVGCKNCCIQDLYIANSGMWTMPLVECDGVYIGDINMNSCWYPNRDGIDLCDSHHVLIENCSIMSDDDTICYKSGSMTGCDEVVVRDTFIVSTQANGMKFGTCSYGGFCNCYSHDCIIKDNRICAICVESVDGGTIENLMFERIIIEDVATPFYVIIGDKGRMPEGGTHRIGVIQNIVFKDIDGQRFKNNYGSYIGGFQKGGETYPLRHIYFENVNLTVRGGNGEIPEEPAEFGKQYPEADCFGILPGSALYIRHAEDVQIENCDIQVERRDVREKIYMKK